MLTEGLEVCSTCSKNLLWGDCGGRDEGSNHVKQIDTEVVDVGVKAWTMLKKSVIFFYFVYGIISYCWLCDFWVIKIFMCFSPQQHACGVSILVLWFNEKEKEVVYVCFTSVSTILMKERKIKKNFVLFWFVPESILWEIMRRAWWRRGRLFGMKAKRIKNVRVMIYGSETLIVANLIMKVIV